MGDAKELFQEANALFIDEDYESALENYNAAIAAGGSNSDYYVKRSATHAKLGSFTEALEDANRALELDNGNTSASEQAWFRKGVACFSLGEYETAKDAFENGIAATSASGGSTTKLQTWLRKCQAELEDESESSEDEVAAPPLPPAPVAPPAPRFRHDWYQTESHVSVSVMAKNQPEASVSFSVPSEGRVRLEIAGSEAEPEPYVLELSLFGKVVPSKCSHKIGKVKVEMKLCKAVQGQWGALEGAADAAVLPISAAGSASSSDAASAPSAYASSRNWDAINADLKKQEEEEKPEGDEALNKLFKDIYSKATPETRRAMNKSFQTSGGTVLSTNWNDVGTTDYEKDIKPPDGMEWKKNADGQ